MKLRFGRYKGWKVQDVPSCYLKWLRRQPGASTELREAITATLGGKATAAVIHRWPAFDSRRAAAGDVD
jgi:Putative quorum-sensing-regulated virulence factor